jgi:hypothetical protein
MRTHKTIVAALAALGLGVTGIALQAGVAYGAQSEPVISTVSSSAVQQTTAYLVATINPGELATTYHFEYGTSSGYGDRAPVSAAAIKGEPGSFAVGAALSGLHPATTYHYRVVAENELGRAVGSDQTFTTLPLRPPVVSTGEAQGVAQNSATLVGTLDTEGYETVYEFDLGVDTSYGTQIFGDAGSELGTQTFTIPMQGLAPGTLYHYRIVATNEFGTIYGADMTFATTIYPSSFLPAPATESLLPAPLLEPAPNTSAKAASVRPASAARIARHGRARSSSRKRRDGRGRKGRDAGHAHNGGGK